jgi:hypothetical protein
MFNKNKTRALAVGALALAAVLVAAGSASAKVQDNGSAGPLYLYASSAKTTNSTVFLWDNSTIGSTSADNNLGAITCAVGSTGAFVFMAPSSSQSNATTKSAWTARQDLGALDGTRTVLSPNLSPAQLNLGSAAGIKSGGGSFYLGVACTNNNGLTVTAAYYRQVSVAAGSGDFQTTDSIQTNGLRFTKQPLSQTVAAGSNVTFTAAFDGTEPTSANYIHWLRAEAGTPSDFVEVVGSAKAAPTATDFSLVLTGATIANDNGAIYKAQASNDNGATYPISSDAATLTVSATTGSVDMNATVVNAEDGTLSLSVAAGAHVDFAAATLVDNFSTSTGTLPDITVNDARVKSRPGWDLTASVNDFTFVNGSVTNTINKSQLGLVPNKVGGTAAGTSVGAIQLAGTAPWVSTVLASGLPGQTVGSTVVNGTLKFVAPQDKPAGTYTSKMTLTVTTK